MEYIWKKFPEEIIKGDNITESGFNYEEEYEKRVAYEVSVSKMEFLDDEE